MGGLEEPRSSLIVRQDGQKIAMQWVPNIHFGLVKLEFDIRLGGSAPRYSYSQSIVKI